MTPYTMNERIEKEEREDGKSGEARDGLKEKKMI
jgi:hypothetical protein